jgi:Tfp pilus assembly protein PilO
MKDKIQAFLQKVPVSLFFIGLIGYQGWDLYDFLVSEASPLTEKKNAKEAVSREVPALEKKLKDLDIFRKKLEGKREDLRQLAVKLDEQRANLSESFDDAGFIKSAYTEGERTRLDVRSVNPIGNTAYGEYYAEHKFEVKFKGVYFQVLLFMQRLTTMPTLVTIDSFYFKPTGLKIQNFAQIEGTINIKGYHYVRSKADDILKQSKKESGGT